MMKFVGIAGSVAEDSYNRKLLTYIASQFVGIADIEILELNEVPMFNQDDDQTDSPVIQYLSRKIAAADGVLLVTPEHNHTTTPAMKNIVEWLSFKVHPFANKPVLILGASIHAEGSARAQTSLRQIMEAPGVGALVMPGDEFLLADAKNAFDAMGRLKDDKTVAFLKTVMTKFSQWVKALTAMQTPPAPWADEDLDAHGRIDSTIDVPMDAPDWVEQGAKKTQAASGKQYVELKRGLLTVEQLTWFLNSMPMELTYVDENNQFIYYNQIADSKDMMAGRTPAQVGQPISVCHPPRAHEHVKEVIWELRNGKTDLFKLPVPGNKINERFIMHYYQAMRDEDKNYRGVNEWVLDIWPIVKDYLTYTHQTLVPAAGGAADTGSSASVAGDTADAGSSASVAEAEPADAGSSASVSD